MSVKELLSVLVPTIIIGVIVVLFIKYKPGPIAPTPPVKFVDVFHIKGPSTTSPTSPQTNLTSLLNMPGNENRLAVYVAEDGWKYLAYGLKSIGIPFDVTNNYKDAVKHRVVILFPTSTRDEFNANAIEVFADFVKKGGTLIAVMSYFPPAFEKIFGISHVTNQKHTELKFSDKAYPDLTNPRESTIRIGSQNSELLDYYSYTPTTSTPIATYEDGSAAITVNTNTNGGKAFAVGVDIARLLDLMPLLELEADSKHLNTSYVYEPSIDVLLRWIKSVYKQQPYAVTLSSVPQGQDLMVIFTHDIDYDKSPENAVAYANYEHQENVPATYFIQTKYVTDYFDFAFFDNNAVNNLRQIANLGMEIGSHSVSHSWKFGEFPIGSGNEEYPTYQPYIVDMDQTDNGTLFGELRVSKYLLETLLKKKVVSFRSGFLLNPPSLVEALVRTGYQFDSSLLARSLRSYYPFQHNDELSKTDFSVYEIPVSFDEGESYNNKVDHLDINSTMGLIESIKNDSGIFVILLHPNIVGEKLEFEKQLITKLKTMPVLFSTIESFGNWWAARDQVQVQVYVNQHDVKLLLTTPVPIEGLTIEIPDTWNLVPNDQNCTLSAQKNKVIIKSLQSQGVCNFIVN